MEIPFDVPPRRRKKIAHPLTFLWRSKRSMLALKITVDVGNFIFPLNQLKHNFPRSCGYKRGEGPFSLI